MLTAGGGGRDILSMEKWQPAARTFKPQPSKVTIGDYLTKARGRFDALREQCDENESFDMKHKDTRKSNAIFHMHDSVNSVVESN